MTTESVTTPKKKNTFVQMLPGLLITVVALAVLFYLVDLDQFIQAIQQADFSRLPLVLILFMGTIMARTFAWRAILQEQISWSKTFWTLNEGYLLNNVLPFRLGELGRAFLLSRTTKLSFWEVLSTIMVERIFDISILAGLLLSTVPFVVGADWAMQAAYGAGGVVIAGFAGLFFLASRPEIFKKLILKFTRPWPRQAEFILSKLDDFLPGLTVLTQPARFLKVLFWMLVTWVTNVGWYSVLLYAFVPNVEPLWAAFTVGMVALGVSAPSTPGFVGVFELATVGALTLFNIDESVATAYAVTGHSIYLVITILLGGIALGRDGQSLGEVYRGIRNRPDQAVSPDKQ